jgi:muscarinic acetylcholine receptor M3
VCDMWLSVDYLASNASALNLVVISFDRYFSVTRPLSYRARRTTRRAALMITSAWFVSALIWLPSILVWPYIEGERTVPENDCYVQFIYTNEYMSIVTIFLAFYIPVMIMIGLYVRVWYETVKRQRELVHLTAGKKASSKRSDSR